MYTTVRATMDLMEMFDYFNETFWTLECVGCSDIFDFLNPQIRAYWKHPLYPSKTRQYLPVQDKGKEYLSFDVIMINTTKR